MRIQVHKKRCQFLLTLVMNLQRVKASNKNGGQGHKEFAKTILELANENGLDK